MDKEQLVEAMGIMGMEVFSKTGQNVYTKCPFGWKHSKGVDSNPSASFKIDPAGPSLYRCWSCGERGTIAVLAKRMVRMGLLTDEQASRVEELELAGSEFSFRCGDTEEKKTPYWKTAAKKVEWNAVPQYALRRGLTMEICTEWKLGHDLKRGRLVFPVWDLFGNGVGMVGRVLGESDGPKYPSYKDFQKSKHLYGEHKLESMDPPRVVVLVEGMLDVLFGWQLDLPYAVLGVMGDELLPKQAQTLSVYADSVVIMFDDDKAGREGAQKAVGAMQKASGNTIPIRLAGEYPDGKKDPKEFTRDEWIRVAEEADLQTGGAAVLSLAR